MDACCLSSQRLLQAREQRWKVLQLPEQEVHKLCMLHDIMAFYLIVLYMKEHSVQLLGPARCLQRQIDDSLL